MIDPHSLLVDDLLRLLVTRNVLAGPHIRHRLIYVDPARTDYVIPFNVLATQAEHPMISPQQCWKPSGAPGRSA